MAGAVKSAAHVLLLGFLPPVVPIAVTRLVTHLGMSFSRTLMFDSTTAGLPFGLQNAAQRQVCDGRLLYLTSCLTRTPAKLVSHMHLPPAPGRTTAIGPSPAHTLSCGAADRLQCSARIPCLPPL